MGVNAISIDSVAIQVWDMDKAIKFFSDLLDTSFSPRITQSDPRWMMYESMDNIGIDLSSPIGESGNTYNQLKKKGEGLAAVEVRVSDIYEAERRAKKMGLRIIWGHLNPDGSGGSLYLHPKDCFGVMLAFKQYTPRIHPFLTKAGPGLTFTGKMASMWETDKAGW